MIQCADFICVDDIINRVATNDINQAQIKTEEMDDVIEKQFEERNVLLNRTEEQSI